MAEAKTIKRTKAVRTDDAAVLQAEIAQAAYELYERDGCVDGKDLEHWLEAERLVLARRVKRSTRTWGVSA